MCRCRACQILALLIKLVEYVLIQVVSEYLLLDARNEVFLKCGWIPQTRTVEKEIFLSLLNYVQFKVLV